ncbi:MAG: HK97 family phage prohead protease [Atopobiaceae bacterium]|nr:HK97 family phage prohead protease [Kiritimatiellia bacterium]MBQ6490895.1 HK97 family phage prohead protease [Atopobiaceae bacterium]
MTKTKSAPGAASMPAEGTVEGYAATFDRIPDAYGDVIKAGAFADSLKAWEQNGKPIPLLYGHSTDDPDYNIGKVVEAHEDEKGLYVVAQFDEENEKAQYVRKLVKEGRLWQFSFAYEVLDGGSVELEDGTEAYELRKMNLFEVSLVQIPANQRAVVTGVKQAPAEAAVELKEALSGETVAIIDTNIAEPEMKSGRRNSKADADELRRIREMAYSIATTVDGLLADEQEDTDTDEAKAEEPSGANAEEPKEDVLAQLKDVAEQLLNS